jgi:hypothetical protein
MITFIGTLNIPGTNIFRHNEAIAKLNKRRHLSESGGPEILEKTGFPLPRE